MPGAAAIALTADAASSEGDCAVRSASDGRGCDGRTSWVGLTLPPTVKTPTVPTMRIPARAITAAAHSGLRRRVTGGTNAGTGRAVALAQRSMISSARVLGPLIVRSPASPAPG